MARARELEDSWCLKVHFPEDATARCFPESLWDLPGSSMGKVEPDKSSSEVFGLSVNSS